MAGIVYRMWRTLSGDQHYWSFVAGPARRMTVIDYDYIHAHLENGAVEIESTPANNCLGSSDRFDREDIYPYPFRNDAVSSSDRIPNIQENKNKNGSAADALRGGGGVYAVDLESSFGFEFDFRAVLRDEL
ncbi:hypothetical protein AAF712_015725 [Marasmius tenuissimus]|uniref:Uncharacterized protein n=1 Tax=Marasmius tenuissimus TaxID=585030 RepID=A0ABR2Z9G4_9AGAR